MNVPPRVRSQGAPSAIWAHKYQGTRSVLEVVEDFCSLFCLPPSTCQMFLDGKLLPKDKAPGEGATDNLLLKHVFLTSQCLGSASAGLATCCCHLSA